MTSQWNSVLIRSSPIAAPLSGSPRQFHDKMMVSSLNASTRCPPDSHEPRLGGSLIASSWLCKSSGNPIFVNQS
eukprot:7470298-Pyramimonas_sp.AAC.1